MMPARSGDARSHEVGPASVWRKLLTGPRLLLGALVAAFIGFVVPAFGPVLVDRLMPGPPIRFDATFDPVGESAIVWAFAEPLQGTRPPAIIPNEGMFTWFVDRGGVQAGESAVRLSVEGRRLGKVRITGLHAHVLGQQPPLRGTLFYLPPQGIYDNSRIGVDLDEAVPVAKRMQNG